MKSILLAIGLILTFCGTYSYVLGPTADEIVKGFVIKPKSSWAQQARIENSMRILCIGGSNTANGDYVRLLDKYLKNSLDFDSNFRNSSYALNRGLSGRGADYFIGKAYDFEASNISTWPNMVIVDTSVNLVSLQLRNNGTQLLLEQLLRTLIMKYNAKKLPSPDFMFYNMPYLRDLFIAAETLNTTRARKEYMASFKIPDDIIEGNRQIESFARYYGFPLLHFGHSVFAAAIRHFLNSTQSFDADPWKYSFDGTHMTPPAGVKFGMDNLLRPLLSDAMKPRAEEEEADKSRIIPAYTKLPRLYPPSAVLIEAVSYSSYFSDDFPDYIVDVNIHNLKEIIHNGKHQWRKQPFPHFDFCFGSDVKDAVGELHFPVPELCSTRDPCQVQISLVHSWNASHIGNARCTMQRLDGSSSNHISKKSGSSSSSSISRVNDGSDVYIDGQAEAEGATRALPSHFALSVTEGTYIVRCVNLIADRLSCITALDLNTVRVV